ncbi:nitroreductase family protein [Holdemania massiliensis]|nr:nitroreductase family protein [Holdemania massiliensis]
MSMEEALTLAKKRRTIRDFDSTPVNLDEIKTCLKIAATAPSGADMQPWHFCVITNEAKKREVRKACEQIEREFYEQRISEVWRQDLKKLNLQVEKPFLSEAPCLIVIFKQMQHADESGHWVPNYYVNESVGIATGFLIQALHQAGYAMLTYTPAPIHFLTKLCHRPDNEVAEMILVVGHARPDAPLPVLKKKTLEEIADFID